MGQVVFPARSNRSKAVVIGMDARHEPGYTLGMRSQASSIRFSGGTVFTVNDEQPLAEALVVSDGEISYVGDFAGSERAITGDTLEVNLGGGMLLPGFIDAHDHLAMGAVTKVGVDLSGLVGTDTVIAAVRDWVAQQPDDATLRGHGWMNSTFESGSPRREWLDGVTGDRPMAILSADAHDLWFNTAAMRACNITTSTPDPVPGVQYYVRDADGTPTGHAVESATVLSMATQLGFFSEAGLREAMKLTIDRAPSWGITANFDAGILVGESQDAARPIIELLIARDQQGELPIRMQCCVWTRNPSDNPQQVANTLTSWHDELKSEHLSVGVTKLWADGTMMSHGSLLLEPFTDEPTTKGTMSFTPEHIEAQIEATQRAGFDIHVHTDGDGTVRVILDAIERVQQRIGRGESRHVICHNTLVHESDVARFHELGVVANVTPLWGTDYNGMYIDAYNQLLGPERVQAESFVYGDLVRSGAVVTYGADIPGVLIDEIAPLLHLEAAVTRQRPGYPNDRVFLEHQRVSVEQAIRCYTLNAAYQLRLEHLVGSLEVGKRADLVWLDRNLLECDPHDIHKAQVLMTMMDGRVTYRGNDSTQPVSK